MVFKSFGPLIGAMAICILLHYEKFITTEDKSIIIITGHVYMASSANKWS